MEKFIFFNGRFVKEKNVKISVLNSSLHYGLSVFEGIKAFKTSKGTIIFRLKEHLKRLRSSAKIMGYSIPYSNKQLTKFVKLLLKKNNLDSAYIRPIVFFQGESIGLKKSKTNIALIAFNLKNFFKNTELKLMISSLTRYSKNKLFEFKVSGNYALSFLAKNKAIQKGFDDAIILNEKKQLTECSTENIFIVKNNTVFTPKTNAILSGITRDSIKKICKNLKIPFKEKNIPLKELFNVSEVFVSGTAAGILPVKQVNTKKYSMKKNNITKKIIQEYNTIIQAKNPKYSKWLEFV